jgi:hypothetical protein
MNKNSDNIIFFLEEKIQETDNLGDIEKMLNELEEIDDADDADDVINYNLTTFQENADIYYSTKKMHHEIYEDYNVKQLLRICDYYDIEKNVKMAKLKKSDIISSIVYFESLSENIEQVNNRHKLWSYIIELTHDSKMKKYIIW